jgi:hypothetical protein
LGTFEKLFLEIGDDVQGQRVDLCGDLRKHNDRKTGVYNVANVLICAS